MRFRHIYCVSDIHTDYKQNLAWAKSLSGHTSDVLLVAGDVSDDGVTFEATMDALAGSFGAVFFVPGNHDLWLKRDGTEGADSLEKLRRLTATCNACGVLTTAQQIAMESGTTMSIVPMLSWYHESFDTEPDITALRLPQARAVVADYKATVWPAPLKNGAETLALHFDELCEGLAGAPSVAEAADRAGLTPLHCYEDARAGGASVLSFSHFLPKIDLIPEKRYLTYPPLMQAVGSHPLGRRVARLRPDVHVFGHTHFGWDSTLNDGVRYIQAALATPAERKRRPRSLMLSYDLDLDLEHDQPLPDAHGEALPLMVYDGAVGAFCPPRRAAWSVHYACTRREPSDTSPAPWVVDFYSRKSPGRLKINVTQELAERSERGKWRQLEGTLGSQKQQSGRVGMFDVQRGPRQP